MPHLHIAEFKEVEIPSSKDGVSFNFIAKFITSGGEINLYNCG